MGGAVQSVKFRFLVLAGDENDSLGPLAFSSIGESGSLLRFTFLVSPLSTALSSGFIRNSNMGLNIFLWMMLLIFSSPHLLFDPLGAVLTSYGAEAALTGAGHFPRGVLRC